MYSVEILLLLTFILCVGMDTEISPEGKWAKCGNFYFRHSWTSNNRHDSFFLIEQIKNAKCLMSMANLLTISNIIYQFAQTELS